MEYREFFRILRKTVLTVNSRGVDTIEENPDKYHPSTLHGPARVEIQFINILQDRACKGEPRERGRGEVKGEREKKREEENERERASNFFFPLLSRKRQSGKRLRD